MRKTRQPLQKSDLFEFLKTITRFISTTLKMEFATEAGRINAIAVVALVILGGLTLLPTALAAVANFVFSFVGKKGLPVLPEWALGFYVAFTPIFLGWCVWIVSKAEKLKRGS